MEDAQREAKADPDKHAPCRYREQIEPDRACGKAHVSENTRRGEQRKAKVKRNDAQDVVEAGKAQNGVGCRTLGIIFADDEQGCSWSSGDGRGSEQHGKSKHG